MEPRLSHDGLVEVRPVSTLADLKDGVLDIGGGGRRRSLSQTSIKSIQKATSMMGHDALGAAEVSTLVGEENRAHSRQASAMKAMERTGVAHTPDPNAKRGCCSLQ